MAIQLKRSLTSQIDQNYILAQGQVGIEMQGAANTAASPFRMKLGDGASLWKELPYFGESAEVDLSSVVPISRTINSKPLSSDIVLTADDVGARGSAWMPTASDVGARPNSWVPSLNDCRGILSVSKGGTGVTTIDALKTALGVGSSSGTANVIDEIPSVNSTPKGVGIRANMFVRLKSSSILAGGYPVESNSPNNQWYYSNDPKNTAICEGTRGSGAEFRWIVEESYSGVHYQTGQVMLDTSAFYGSGITGSGLNSSEIMLGSEYGPWKAVYASTGIIQSSDASVKHAIHYLSDASIATVDEDGKQVAAMSLENVIDFINTTEPATFVYNDASHEIATDDPSNRQLGLIANDVETHPLFPYIGGRYTWEAHGDIPAGSSLALKPIPLAVAALTACKYLLTQVDSLQEQLDSLSSKIA